MKFYNLMQSSFFIKYVDVLLIKFKTLMVKNIIVLQHFLKAES